MIYIQMVVIFVSSTVAKFLVMLSFLKVLSTKDNLTKYNGFGQKLLTAGAI